MSVDLGIIGASLFGFIAVLCFQAVVFRKLDEAGIFPALIQSGIIGFCFNVIGILLVVTHFHLSILEALLVGASASLIYAMVSLVYVLCIFGPFTTSVRIRLLREIASSPQGLTRDELDKRYNNSIILDIRLKRLIGSRYIAVQGNQYILQRKDNVFHLMDVIANSLKFLIHGPKT